jgi:hypothetical protein
MIRGCPTTINHFKGGPTTLMLHSLRLGMIERMSLGQPQKVYQKMAGRLARKRIACKRVGRLCHAQKPDHFRRVCPPK